MSDWRAGLVGATWYGSWYGSALAPLAPPTDVSVRAISYTPTKGRSTVSSAVCAAVITAPACCCVKPSTGVPLMATMVMSSRKPTLCACPSGTTSEIFKPDVGSTADLMLRPSAAPSARLRRPVLVGPCTSSAPVENTRARNGSDSCTCKREVVYIKNVLAYYNSEHTIWLDS